MSKRDVIDDEQIAQRFVWRMSEPEDAPAEEPKQDSPPPAADDSAPPADDSEALQANRERWQRARQVAAALAKDIMFAWQVTARAQVQAATASLLHRDEVEPAADLLRARFGARFELSTTGPYAFFKRWAPFLMQ